MKAQTVRDYLAVHTWVGILCGMVLFIAFYAGAFAMIEPEIARWARPAAQAQPSAHASADADAAVRAYFDAHPDSRARLRLLLPGPDRASPLLQASVRGGDEQWFELDQSGHLAPLAFPKDEDSSGNFVDYLHRKGGLPLPLEWAEPLIGLVSLAYALALISGVVVLLPSLVKDLFYLRLGRNLKRMWLDVHNLLGVSSLPFHVVIAVSAAVFGLHDVIYAVQDKLIYRDGLRATMARASAEPPTVAPQDWLAPSELVRRVQQQAPHFQPMALDYIRQPQRTVLLMSGIDDHHQFKRGAHVGFGFVNLGTGELYDRTYFPGGDGSSLAAALRSFFSLHFGSFGGDPVRVLYILLGLSGALIFYTGNLLWIESRTKRSRKAGQPAEERPRHVRVVSALTVGTCLGCAAGLPSALVAAKWLSASLPNLDPVLQGSYLAVFLACIAWALARGTARAAPALLWFTAACNALVPLTSVAFHLIPGLTQRHGPPPADAPWLETLCLLLALFFGWLAWRHQRKGQPTPVTPLAGRLQPATE